MHPPTVSSTLCQRKSPAGEAGPIFPYVLALLSHPVSPDDSWSRKGGLPDDTRPPNLSLLREDLSSLD
jgi:hypothetical protein